MLIGYVRCVPTGADETAQIKMMVDHKVTKFFTEQTGSRSVELKARQDLLNFAREGDSVLVNSIQVIARNIGELLDVMRQLEEKQVTFVSIAEDIDTGNEKGQFLLSILKAMASLDTDSIVGQRREDDAKAYADRAAGNIAPAKPASKVLSPSQPPAKPSPAPNQTSAPKPAPAPAPKPQPKPDPPENSSES